MLGDCRNQSLVEDIFGSVSEFARLVETLGDRFRFEGVAVSYDPDSDIHTFREM